ncbi:hypothetical protein MTO96_043491 [Rhipicephalus appendiculatus]
MRRAVLQKGEGQPEEEGPADGASEEGPPDREEGQPELPVELSESFSKEEGESGAATDELLDSYKKRVQLLENQLDEERQRNARLCDALLDKIEIARSVCTCTKPRQGEHVVAQHVVAQLLVPQVSSEGAKPVDYEVLAEGMEKDDSTLLRAITPPPSQSPPDVVDRASGAQQYGAAATPLQLFEEVGEDVHVGSGILMKAAKLRFIMRSQNEMKVAREMARYFWTPAEMQERSLTGQPCRRQADSVGKLQATPQKADAIMNVIQKVIEDCPSDIEVAKRVALGRKSLRNIFAEMGRLGLRKRMPA